MPAQNVTWVSVWCRAYSVDFGHAVMAVSDLGAGAVGPATSLTALLNLILAHFFV